MGTCFAGLVQNPLEPGLQAHTLCRVYPRFWRLSTLLASSSQENGVKFYKRREKIVGEVVVVKVLFGNGSERVLWGALLKTDLIMEKRKTTLPNLILAMEDHSSFSTYIL